MDSSDMNVNEVRLQMYELLEEESYMKPLLDLAFQYLRDPIMVVDHTQRLIDFRQKGSVSSQRWQYVIDTGEFNLTLIDSDFYKNYTHTKQTKETFSFVANGYTYHQCSIMCHNIFMGNVCLLEYDNPVDESDWVILKTVAQIISIKIESTINLTNEVERHFGQILIDLLESNIKRKSDLKYRMQICEWEDKETYTVALFRTRETGEGLNKHIRRSFSDLHRGIKSIVYDGYLLVLLEQNNIDEIRLDYQGFCLQHNLRVGISNTFYNLLDISLFYAQAQKALEYSYHKTEIISMARYGDYIVEDIAQKLCMTDANNLLYHPTVTALIEYDEKHNTNFGETLYTYIEQNRSITKTSQKIFQHKNTINYRIQRIKTLLDLDLDDFNELAHIYMTYKIIHANKKKPM